MMLMLHSTSCERLAPEVDHTHMAWSLERKNIVARHRDADDNDSTDDAD